MIVSVVMGMPMVVPMVVSVIMAMMVMMVVAMAVPAMDHAMVLGPVAIRADADDVVMMADLGRAVVVFITDDLLAVFAQQAVHFVVAVQGFFDPVGFTDGASEGKVA